MAQSLPLASKALPLAASNTSSIQKLLKKPDDKLKENQQKLKPIEEKETDEKDTTKGQKKSARDRSSSGYHVHHAEHDGATAEFSAESF